MSIISPPQTKRYKFFKFVYTADNGEQFVRSQRIDKDINGNFVFSLPPCFQEAELLAKEKIWGDPSNLRKTIVKYIQPSNQSGEAQITIYVPEPSPNTTQCIREIVKIADNLFSSNCVEYYGENRFTQKEPNRLRNI